MLDTLSSLPTLTSNQYELERDPEHLGWLEAVPEKELHNHKALWQRFERDGYLFLKGILDRQQILAFREYYFRTLALAGLLKPGTASQDGILNPGAIDELLLKKILVEEIVPSKQYEELCTSPEIINFSEWFLGGKILMHKHRIIRALRPGNQIATGAHFDLSYLRDGTKKVYTSWIPLGDCPLEQGGLIYLEKSHVSMEKFEKSSETYAFRMTRKVTELAQMLNSRWLIANYEAGDMMIHSPYMIHSALNNVCSNGVIRLSTDIRYQLVDDSIDPHWQTYWHPDNGI